MKMSYKNLQCEVKAQSGLKTEIGDLCAQAVSYAICRCFVKSEALCREYVYESYRMRLAAGKGRKPKHHSIILEAAQAEVEGELLHIEFTVDTTGVTVQSIRPLARRIA